MPRVIPRNGCSISAEFVAADATAAAISVVAPPALCTALSRSMPAVAEGRIRFIALKPRELRLCTHRSLSIAAFARWWTMRRYLVRSGADFGFFLSLDLLCLPFALGLRMRGKPIAGILFRPSVHYAALGKYRPSSAERLRDLRKDLLYRLMLRNPSIRTVLSLDPFFPGARRFALQPRPQGADRARSRPAGDGAVGRRCSGRRFRAARPHWPAAVWLSDRTQGTLDGARRPAAVAAGHRRPRGRAVRRPHRSRHPRRHRQPPLGAGARPARAVAAHRGPAARSAPNSRPWWSAATSCWRPISASSVRAACCCGRRGRDVRCSPRNSAWSDA